MLSILCLVLLLYLGATATAASDGNDKTCHVVGTEGGGASSYYRHLAFCTSAATCDPARLSWIQQYSTPFGLLSNNTGCAAVNGSDQLQVPCDGTLYVNQQGSGGVYVQHHLWDAPGTTLTAC